jgi:hypothetical protein
MGKRMTIAEQMIRGLYILTIINHKDTFTRLDLRNALKIDRFTWDASFNPVFQALRIDEPGRAPLVREALIGLIKRTSYGVYKLTPKGKDIVNKYP